MRRCVFAAVMVMALIILLAAAPARALEVRFSGNFRVRSCVQAEYDGRNEWTATSISNALASGNYAATDIYDRGSHFLRMAPGGEDNPNGPGYATFLNLAGGGPAAHLANETNIGPALAASIRGSQDNVDDERVYTDVRWRLWVTFQISDRLRQVTAFEVGDSAFGLPRPGRSSGGTGWGADDVTVEVKQCYLDFSAPSLPFANRFKTGLIPLKLHRGWIVNADVPGLLATATFEPVTLGLVYVRALEGGAFEDRSDDADLYAVFAACSRRGLGARASLVYQDGPSSTFTSNQPGSEGDVDEFGNTIMWYGLDLDYTAEAFKLYFTGVMNGGSNDYYRLDDRTQTGAGAAAGSTRLSPVEADYNGWMFDLGCDVFLGPLTLMFEGFYLTGDEFRDHSDDASAAGVENFFLMEDADDEIDRFVYPGPSPWNIAGATHFWSEILGGGTFDQNAGGSRSGIPTRQAQVSDGAFGQWRGTLQPYNVWAVKLGGKYKVAETTAVSAFYWYAATAEDVVSSINEAGRAAFGNPGAYGNVTARDSSIGHEVDLYLDQAVCRGLKLRLAAACLFADDAYSVWTDDEDAYEYGLRLQVSF